MANYDVPVVRIVVEGCPSAASKETNVPEASKMLLQAFSNEGWSGNSMFAIAPGGFIAGPFPKRWDGSRGWSSCPEDFQELVRHAEGLVRQVLTRQVLEAARTRAEFLTLGVDLKDWSGTRTHAELVVIVDVNRGKPVQWTGKSYPVSWQERTLVQETNLESHLFPCGTDRVLVLGCHDLNMFSPRARANMKAGSWKHRRSKRMRELTREFRPTMILHHPHSTDSPRIWTTAWSGARELLPRKVGGRHVWASAIGFYNRDAEKARGTLCDVQRATRCCAQQVVDICVRPEN